MVNRGPICSICLEKIFVLCSNWTSAMQRYPSVYEVFKMLIPFSLFALSWKRKPWLTSTVHVIEKINFSCLCGHDQCDKGSWVTPYEKEHTHSQLKGPSCHQSFAVEMYMERSWNAVQVGRAHHVHKRQEIQKAASRTRVQLQTVRTAPPAE